jgi:N-acylglucosamine 2-epimerase
MKAPIHTIKARDEGTGIKNGSSLADISGMKKLLSVYRDGLMNDTVPFWFPRAVDREYGGFITSLDRDGTILQTDKAIWLQGRFVWMLATLYNTVEKRPEWLALARQGVDFINQYGFDADGRMFFSVTREGRPLRKRRYIFSECFTIIALAAYGVASNEHRYKQQALALFKQVLQTLETPDVLEPKTNPETRAMKGLSVPMCLIVTAQELRKAVDDPLCTEIINRCIDEVARDFLKPEFKSVLETVGPHGEFYDTFEGRMINPGHSIELGWFILEEARVRGGSDRRLLELGLKIIEVHLRLAGITNTAACFTFAMRGVCRAVNIGTT